MIAVRWFHAAFGADFSSCYLDGASYAPCGASDWKFPVMCIETTSCVPLQTAGLRSWSPFGNTACELALSSSELKGQIYSQSVLLLRSGSRNYAPYFFGENRCGRGMPGVSEDLNFRAVWILSLMMS